jgi:Spy/CpxP family protein refolding chaperone
MKRALWLVPAIVGLGLAGRPVAAQDKPGDDAIARALFDPQLVLKHAREIGLGAEQRRAIMDAIKATQTELVPLQLDMAEPALDLVALLEQERVDEAAAIAKADQVLKIENQVKKLQMTLLVRIKNLLSARQQDALGTLRDRDKRGRDGGGEGTPSGDAPRPVTTLEGENP